MGEVYLARDLVLNRSVALKRVSPKLKDDPQYKVLLIREAQRLSRLDHDGIARIHDVLEVDGDTFLVMEFVPGKSLRTRIGSPMPVDQFIPIATECLQALSAAHDAGILHRDIKPENIIVSDTGKVKLCDFGLAALIRDPQKATTRETQCETLRGTPSYMSSEALLGQTFDQRSDLFALGVVFYELLAGKHPFLVPGNYAATVDAILHGTPAKLSSVVAGIPSELETTIEQLLAKDRKDRPASATSVIDAFPTVISEPPATPKQRFTIRTKLVAVAASIVITIGMVLAMQSTPTAAGPERRNLVVLPFRAIGQPQETQFYSDGLTETLTARLGRFTKESDLVVAPASEVRTRRVTTAGDARRLFGATLVLSGTLQRVGDVVRVNFALFDAATLQSLDADSFAANAAEPSSVEDRLIERVSKTLSLPVATSTANHHQGTGIGRAYELYLRGRGYLQRLKDSAQMLQGIDSFHQALNVDPAYADAYAGLGQAYWRMFEITQENAWTQAARDACEKSRSLAPDSPEGHICVGLVENGMGAYEKAAAEFERALDIEPTSDDAYRELARSLESLSRFDAAERTLKRSIQLKPDFFLGYNRLGAFYLRRARYAEALTQLRQMTQLIPNDNESWVSMSAAQIYLGQYADAVTTLKHALELKPSGRAYANLGSTYMRMHRFDDAVAVFEQAVQAYPKSYSFVGSLARAYYWAGKDPNRALATFERATDLALQQLKVNPRDPNAHIMLSRYFAMLDKRSDALAHLRAALQIRPREAEFHSIAAVVHNQLGDRTGAIADLKTAMSLGWSVAEINTEVEFDQLRKDPQFLKQTISSDR